jgi:nitrite reductase (NADH) large subunit
LDRDQLICVCQDVTAGEIVDAIRRHGDIDEVKRCTGACVTCLGCEMEIEELFDQYAPPAEASGTGAGRLAAQGVPA